MSNFCKKSFVYRAASGTEWKSGCALSLYTQNVVPITDIVLPPHSLILLDWSFQLALAQESEVSIFLQRSNTICCNNICSFASDAISNHTVSLHGSTTLSCEETGDIISFILRHPKALRVERAVITQTVLT